MPTVVEKLAFKVPAEAVPAVKVARAAVVPTALLGTWSNCDRGTRGLLRLKLSGAGTTVNVQAFGACTPTPCDWGVTPAVIHAADVGATPGIAFSAKYKFPFKETVLTGVIDRGALVVETFERFTDGSGRSNYYTKAYFAKS
jgi:hypothetical protein